MAHCQSVFLSFVRLTNGHISTPAAATTVISSVCPTCGTIDRSGKASCCGRGGSWFGNCGSVGSAKFHHTWYEGIRVCTARSQSKAAIGQQPHAAQHKSTHPMAKTPTALLMTTPITSQTCENDVRINLLIMIFVLFA